MVKTTFGLLFTCIILLVGSATAQGYEPTGRSDCGYSDEYFEFTCERDIGFQCVDTYYVSFYQPRGPVFFEERRSRCCGIVQYESYWAPMGQCGWPYGKLSDTQMRDALASIAGSEDILLPNCEGVFLPAATVLRQGHDATQRASSKEA